MIRLQPHSTLARTVREPGCREDPGSDCDIALASSFIPFIRCFSTVLCEIRRRAATSFCGRSSTRLIQTACRHLGGIGPWRRPGVVIPAARTSGARKKCCQSGGLGPPDLPLHQSPQRSGGGCGQPLGCVRWRRGTLWGTGVGISPRLRRRARRYLGEGQLCLGEGPGAQEVADQGVFVREDFTLEPGI